MNNQANFDELITKNTGIIQKVCRIYTDNRDDFLDIYQEVCLQLWKSYGSFKGQSSLSTWIYRVAINTCLGQLRKDKKRQPHQSLENHHHAIRSHEEDHKQEQIDRLYVAIRSLKETDRALILLYLEDKSYKEITEILGMSMSNVGVRINRIKNQLKEMINGK